MRALTWQGERDVRVETVPDPRIEEPTDAIIKVTSTAICGSDLHLYEVLGPFLEPGDILGHEPMGIVEEVGSAVTNIKVGDRVVIPFNISCGSCWMCSKSLYAQCETTQNTETGKGASLFGYTSLYGSVPGGQAEYLRVPQAHFGPIVVPDGVPDERYLYLSDVLPTAWQAVVYADVPKDGTLVVLGLGPIGVMATRIARQLGVERVIGVGMEAAHSPVEKVAHGVVGLLPDKIAEKMMDKIGIDRMGALHTAVKSVRRGGTVSVSGVYGGETDPMPLMEMFDRGIQLRMGQCHVKRWIDDILPVVQADCDPLGLEDFATHREPLEDAAAAYTMFQDKTDACFKVVLKP